MDYIKLPAEGWRVFEPFRELVLPRTVISMPTVFFCWNITFPLTPIGI